MRPLVELLAVILVVYAGWQQPFKDHAAALFPDAGIEPSRTAIIAQRGAARLEGASPTFQQPPPRANTLPKNPAWMWNETSMDRPYK